MNLNFKQNIPFLLALAIFVCLAILFLNNGHNWGGDFALYIEQAEALNHWKIKELLIENTFTVNHSSSFLSPNLYPIGYPLFLMLPVLIFGKHLIAYKILNILLLLHLFWRFNTINSEILQLNNCIFISWILLVFFRDTLFFQLEIIGPDILYLVLMVELFYAIMKQRNKSQYLLCLLLLFTRDAGMIPWSIICIFALLRKEFWSIIILIIGIVYLILTKEFSANHWVYFYNEFGLDIFLSNLNQYYLQLMDSLIPMNRIKNTLVRGTVFVFFLIGLFQVILKIFSQRKQFFFVKRLNYSELQITLIYLIYFLIHLFWPRLSLRMILPFDVFALLVFVIGLNKVTVFSINFVTIKIIHLPSSLFKFIIYLLVLSISLKHIYRSYSWCYKPNNVFGDQVSNHQIKRVWSDIRTKTENDALILFRKPRVLRLFTKRRSCNKICSIPQN